MLYGNISLPPLYLVYFISRKINAILMFYIIHIKLEFHCEYIENVNISYKDGLRETSKNELQSYDLAIYL